MKCKQKYNFYAEISKKLEKKRVLSINLVVKVLIIIKNGTRWASTIGTRSDKYFHVYNPMIDS